jgi:signal transduction histidine kinase
MLGNGAQPIDRLSGLCDAFRAQSGVDCRLDVRPEHARLEPAVADTLVRAVRELLALQKQARANRIVVASELREDGSVVFHVKDESCGSDVAAHAPSPLERDGVALWNIDRVLREVGAYLEIQAEPRACASVVFPGQLLVVS